MKRQPSNRSALLLMEIIIAILFFSIVSAICLQLFVKSHNLSRSTEILDDAVAQTSSVAEMISASQDTLAALTPIYPDLLQKNGNIYLYYDEKFDVCNRASAKFYIEVDPNATGKGGVHLEAYNMADKETIYSLDIVVYRQKKL